MDETQLHDPFKVAYILKPTFACKYEVVCSDGFTIINKYSMRLVHYTQQNRFSIQCHVVFG